MFVISFIYYDCYLNRFLTQTTWSAITNVTYSTRSFSNCYRRKALVCWYNNFDWSLTKIAIFFVCVCKRFIDIWIWKQQQQQTGYDYDRVKKWTRNIDIFALEKVILRLYRNHPISNKQHQQIKSNRFIDDLESCIACWMSGVCASAFGRALVSRWSALSFVRSFRVCLFRFWFLVLSFSIIFVHVGSTTTYRSSINVITHTETHTQQRWSTVLNIAQRRIEYYDSLGHDNAQCIKLLRRSDNVFVFLILCAACLSISFCFSRGNDDAQCIEQTCCACPIMLLRWWYLGDCFGFLSFPLFVYSLTQSHMFTNSLSLFS